MVERLHQGKRHHKDGHLEGAARAAVAVVLATRKPVRLSGWPGVAGRLSPKIDLWLKEIAPNDAVRRRFYRDAATKSDLVTVILSLLSRPRRGRPR